MNERIRELALEVFSFKYKSNPNELNPGHHVDHIHKFAESIIQECLNMCDWQTGQRIQKHFEYRDNRWAETQHNPKPF